MGTPPGPGDRPERSDENRLLRGIIAIGETYINLANDISVNLSRNISVAVSVEIVREKRE